METNTLTGEKKVDTEAAEISEVPDKSMNEVSAPAVSDSERITIAPSEPKATAETQAPADPA